MQGELVIGAIIAGALLLPPLVGASIVFFKLSWFD
jgi:hypothetical protein